MTSPSLLPAPANGSARVPAASKALLVALGMLLLAGPTAAQDQYASQSAEVLGVRPVELAPPRLSPLERHLERLQQPVTVRFEGATMQAALEAVGREGGFKLVTSGYPDLHKRRVALALDGAPLLEALYAVVAGTDYRFMLSPSGYLVVVKRPGGAAALSAEAAPAELAPLAHVVSGLVTSADDGSPLPGVNIQVKGTTIGAITDVDGRFSLDAPSPNDTLVFSFVGFTPREVPLAGRSVIEVTLETDNVALDEVVVIGYGEVRRADLTGSVASVDVEKITQMPLTSINEGLAGRVPGVQLTKNSGRPGGGVTMRIRGYNSLLGSNDPLYVIDGVPVSGEEIDGGDHASNPLATINPQDIESIQVLKDASSTAIYGSRGSNGVVLITTKRGRSGQFNVNFDAYYSGQQEMAQLDVLNAAEYARYYNEWYDTAEQYGELGNANLQEPKFTEAQIAAFERGEVGADWPTLAVRESAPIQSYQLSLSGGSSALRYYASGNYFNQQGILKSSGFDRGSFKVNLNGNSPSALFRYGSSVTLTQASYDGYFGNSTYGDWNGGYIDAYLNVPILPVRLENGDYNQDNPYNPGGVFRNIAEQVEALERDQRQTRVLANAFATYELLPGISFKAQLGADVLENDVNQYFPTYSSISQYLGTASKRGASTRTWLNEYTLNFDRGLGANHSFGGVVGYSWQRSNWDGTYAQAQGFTDDLLGWNNLEGGDPDRLQSSAWSGEWKLLSYLGRLNYDYAGRYLLTLTGRYDGSSKFGADDKWAFFPSAALAWRISSEPFMRQVSALDDLKLRVSYGQTGNQAIGPYGTLTQVGTRIASADGLSRGVFMYPSQLGNPALRWETTTQFDVGLDAILLDGRLSLTADYFYKQTDDLLFDSPLPLTNSGYDLNQAIVNNIGSLENQGLEFALSGSPVQSGRFAWASNFNITWLKSAILDLGANPDGSPRDSLFLQPTLNRAGNADGYGITIIGRPLGNFYSYVLDGIVDDEQELNAAPQYPGIDLGSPIYRDLNGDGEITAEDRTVTGNAFPDFIGGFQNTLSFAGVDVGAFLEFSIGNDVFNATRYTFERQSKPTQNKLAEWYEGVWREGSTDARFPRLNQDMRFVDTYIEDASYLRLKSVTVGYTLPRSLTTDYGIGRARLYLTGTNLLTLTGYSGIDPDVNSFGSNQNFAVGIDYGTYPSVRTYTIGLNMQF